MAKLPDAYVGKRLFVGQGNPECLGRGPLEVRGSMYCEGPSCLLYTSPSPRDRQKARMPSSA